MDPPVFGGEAQRRHHAAAEIHRRAGVARRDEHHLNDEIELLHRRRRVCKLHDVIFQEEGDVVEKLDAQLPVDTENCAIHIYFFATA